MTMSEQFNQVLRDWTETFMRRSMQDFVQFSKDSGLSMTQLHTLFRLHHAGICGVTDVGDHLGVTNAAASQMVDRLVQQGLIERAEDPSDRRVKQLSLTPKGLRLVLDSIEARRHWMEQLTDVLDADELEQIIRALTILTRTARYLEPADMANTSQDPLRQKAQL
jgi:DNA-binding MarR family transcriptional regulator